jgi:hypothetical protein
MLGAIRDDINKILGYIPGASGKLAELEKYIRGEAEAGALQAVPKIRAEVRDEVKPYIIGAIGVGALGVLIGIWALVAARRTGHTAAVAGLLGASRRRHGRRPKHPRPRRPRR